MSKVDPSFLIDSGKVVRVIGDFSSNKVSDIEEAGESLLKIVRNLDTIYPTLKNIRIFFKAEIMICNKSLEKDTCEPCS
jgi:hypothetical protein